MRRSTNKGGHPRAPGRPRTLDAKSIILQECGLSATVVEPGQPRPQIIVALGPEHRVVSFGAFLTFCLDAIEVCRPSLPAQTGLLVETREHRGLARTNR
jgi:hypothetical protein